MTNDKLSDYELDQQRIHADKGSWAYKLIAHIDAQAAEIAELRAAWNDEHIRHSEANERAEKAEAERKADLEHICKAITNVSFATGHADTLEEAVDEWAAQCREMQAERDALRERLRVVCRAGYVCMARLVQSDIDCDDEELAAIAVISGAYLEQAEALLETNCGKEGE